jgi:hypothetical protein
MGRRVSNLRGGGDGSNLPVGRSAAGPSSVAAVAVDALVGTRTLSRTVTAGSAGGPIGAAALPRSSGSQSITMRVLARVRLTGEEGEGGKGTGDASMGESG